MGYMSINENWYKKEYVQSRAETPQITRIFANSTTLILNEVEHTKVNMDLLECNMQVFQDMVGKVKNFTSTLVPTWENSNLT